VKPAPAASRRSGPVDPRLWRRAAATRRYLVSATAVGTLTAVLVVIQARLLSQGIAGVFASRTADAALAAAPGLVAAFAGRALLSWLGSVLAHRASAAVKSQLRVDILTARLAAPTAPATSASLTALTTQGLDALDGYFARYLPQLVLAATVPVVVGVAVLSQDWVSAVVIALTLPLVPVFMVLVGWLTQTLVGRRWRVQSRLGHHFADLVAGLPTLQVFGRARAQAEGLRRAGEAHRRETMAALRVSFLSALVLELLATLSVAVVAVAVGLRVVGDQLDLATALFVLVLAPEAYLPLRQVGTHYHDSADGVAAVEQAFALVDAAGPPEAAVRPVPDLSTSTVELVGAGLRHPGSGADSLSGLDLLLGPGEVVALSGPSGSGKSTALSLVLGLDRPTTGRVLVGGHDLADLGPAAWRAQLAWVPQRPALLRGTVGSNIALGAPDAPRQRVREALDRSGAPELDLDQAVEAGTEGLSAGEIRRVALARALLRVQCGGARLLLLDEPTAGLDAEHELAAVAGLRRLGVSALVVSHRPAVLAAADRVVALGSPTQAVR